MTRPTLSELEAEAVALGFVLTTEQLKWVEMLLSDQPVTFIASRGSGRDYAMKAAVAISEARRG